MSAYYGAVVSCPGQKLLPALSQGHGRGIQPCLSWTLIKNDHPWQSPRLQNRRAPYSMADPLQPADTLGRGPRQDGCVHIRTDRSPGLSHGSSRNLLCKAVNSLGGMGLTWLTHTACLLCLEMWWAVVAAREASSGRPGKLDSRVILQRKQTEQSRLPPAYSPATFFFCFVRQVAHIPSFPLCFLLWSLSLSFTPYRHGCHNTVLSYCHSFYSLDILSPLHSRV
jgi:hypothetical protein